MQKKTLGRDTRFPWITERIVDVSDSFNRDSAIHMTVPVNVNIRTKQPDLLLQRIRSQYGINESMPRGYVVRHDVDAGKEMREGNNDIVRGAGQRMVHCRETRGDLAHS